MSSWLRTWLPALPSIDLSLPTSIQRRFLSFALRQALGHLLKPGQLDTQQVDAQIGSGFVQVRDVELENEAINSLITGLPLRLHDGSLGKVTARIPWPNPLTATIGLSLESLHLTFLILPETSGEIPVHSSLAESVTSVAETFIHDELDPDEEASLRDSFHPDLDASEPALDSVPGGLDPFMNDEGIHNESDPSGVSVFASLLERLLSRFHFDATDTKITFVHPEYASFTITIPDIRYQTDAVNDISSSVSSAAEGKELHGGRAIGTIRSVTISGISVTTRCLRPQSPQHISVEMPKSPTSTTPPTIQRSPPSPTFSDSSELDEETQMIMSQSIAGLPPRPGSPASSVASSMYQSAISIAPTGPPPPMPTHSPEILEQGNLAQVTLSTTPPASANVALPELGVVTDEIQDETILSFGTEPVTIRLSTPPPVRQSIATTSLQTPPSDHEIHKPSGALKLEVSLGVVAVALKARHLRSLLDISHLWASHTSPKVEEGADDIASRSLFDCLDADLRIRGFVLLLLPSHLSTRANDVNDSLVDFFNHALVPPRLLHGYMRTHLDSINASMSIRPTSESATSRTTTPKSVGSIITASLSLADISAFAFLALAERDTEDMELRVSPILITDPNLPCQYSTMHERPDLRSKNSTASLPSFDIVDWTDPAHQTSSPRPSQWRAKVPQNSKLSGQGAAQTSTSPRRGSASTSHSPHTGKLQPGPSTHSAMKTKFTMVTRRRDGRTSRSKGKAPTSSIQLQVDIAPLHVFTDLSLVFGSEASVAGTKVLAFLQELSSTDIRNDSQNQEDDESEDEPEDDDTPPATPRASSPYMTRKSERDEERERKRLERMVLEDLNLGYDYRQDAPAPSSRTPGSQFHDWPKRKKHTRNSNQMSISIAVPMIRLEARASPHGPDTRRSGALILDIHDIHVFPGDPPPVKHTTRFAIPDDDDPTDERAPQLRQEVESSLMFGECEKLVLAYSPAGESKASILFSLGSITPEHDEETQGGWSGSPQARPTSHKLARLRPQFTVSQSSSKPLPAASDLTTLTVTLDIPCIYVLLCKPILDGLQIWADDLSQMVERGMGLDSPDAAGNGSKDPSLIGSRFFAKTRRSHDSGTDSASVVSAQRTTASTETIVKIQVADFTVRLEVPRESDEARCARPFDIIASDVDVLFEVKPEGKDQTVVTVGVSDLEVIETSKDDISLKFLGITQSHNQGSNFSSRPVVKLRFVSLLLPETSAKESRIKVTLYGLTYTLHPDIKWMSELGSFFKAPPGVFESVPPSERTRISVKLVDSSICTLAATHPGSMVLHIGELDFSTVIEGHIPETSLHVGIQKTSLYLIDDIRTIHDQANNEPALHKAHTSQGWIWKALGYALILELDGLSFGFSRRFDIEPPDVQIAVDGADLRLHLCADTGTALGAFIGALIAGFSNPDESPAENVSLRQPTEVASPPPRRSLLASLDEHAFLQQIPQVGPAPDLVNDDLPTNPDYLDDSFGTAGGLRALDDEDDDFEQFIVSDDQSGVISKHGGETIRLLDPNGLHIVDNYFDTLSPDPIDDGSQYGDTILKVRLHDCNVSVFLYDGYDWQRTRRIIEEKQKEIRRKLVKIRQLVASGQTPDPSVEETSTLLFNSVYIGLEHNIDEMEPGALIAAIDEELNDDLETASQSSWQSLKPQQQSPIGSGSRPKTKRSNKRLARSKGPCIDFRLQHLDVDLDNYRSDPVVASRALVTIRDVDILDHIRTSTWSKFLTSLATDSKGNIRESGSNMVRVELQKVYPVPGNPAEEARLKAKLLPLRLYVDQDALDFMKQFFSFNDSNSSPAPSEPPEEIFFQQVEVFPVDIKLDYKPRRVDYRALRAGRTIELMNFFHFDGAEMTLRHITLTGITGWARAGDLLNDLWTPDVKATQLVDVISGVAPIRSVVNVGSGVADLVLLPIAQYRKDGRIIRGLQKGTTAFVQSTAVEAIKLGARLATGTQVILEQAEHVIGGQFDDPVTAEAVQLPPGILDVDDELEVTNDNDEMISRYAEQPMNVKEGVKSAVRSLKRNFNSAAQTILAVPMEVYERSGNEGAVRAVVRAVPIAVLKPMIGASEAVSKTLMGIHNSLDPNVRTENEAKYKHR